VPRETPGKPRTAAKPDTAFVPSIGVAVGQDIDAIARDLDHVDAASVTLEVYATAMADRAQSARARPPRAALAVDATTEENRQRRALP
jgi:hypothetical protein